MKKKIKDVTFEEFDQWCNRRACDGQWSICLALNCLEAIRLVLAIKPLFGIKKAREKEWERIKNVYFNLDAELELN